MSQQAFLSGITFRSHNFSNDTIMLISYPGELFLRLLKLVTLPMLISSLITVSANLNARMNGKIVSRTIIYFASTSMLSAFSGICIGILFKPGNASVSRDVIQDRIQKTNFLDSILDLGRYILNLMNLHFQSLFFFVEIYSQTICSKRHFVKLLQFTFHQRKMIQ